MTAILDILLQRLDFETRNNADWLDGWLIFGDPTAQAVADPTNVGNGTISPITVQSPAQADAYRVHISEVVGSVTYFGLRDVTGIEFKRGIVGATMQAQGMEFTLSQGATPFKVGDGFTIAVVNQPLDLTGISFRLTLRKNEGSALAYSPEVALSVLSRENGEPDANGNVLHNTTTQGIVSARIPASRMKVIKPGLYDYDLIAEADGHINTAAVGTVDHLPGVY